MGNEGSVRAPARRRALQAWAWAAAALAAPRIARAVTPRVDVLQRELALPWGMDFLPDGRMLVTQKPGSMVVLDAAGTRVLATISGLPAVYAQGMGGLHDVALDPRFAADPWVYWTYAEADADGASATAVARGRLVGDALRDVGIIFRQQPKVGLPPSHYGARLAFRADGTLFVALGDRKRLDPPGPDDEGGPRALWRAARRSFDATLARWRPPEVSPQHLGSHLGKVVRIHRDGRVPADNPFVATPGARPEIWSIGHRNPQGAAIHPATGELWITEHGPQGGDELNRIVAGGNYGWPLHSYGCPYGAPVGDDCRVGGGRHGPGHVEPVSTWTPISIAPSGLDFCSGERFPAWRGDALVGALAGTALWRVALDGTRETARERLLGELGERIRCVRQGPDGWIYLLTGSGKLLRLRQ